MTTSKLREKASLQHEKTCVVLEKALLREHEAHEILLEAIEIERQTFLNDICCRPHGAF